MTFWLGRPGTVLTALPHPGRGIDAPFDIPQRVAGTIGGGRTVDRAPTGRRTYELDWKSLTPEQHSIVEEFQLGARGPGPHVLLDPWRRNHLTANQSSATSVTNGITGFTPSVAETVTSSTALVQRGPRSLAWIIPSSATAGILTITPPPGHTYWPTPALATWTYSVSIRGAGTDPVVTHGYEFEWINTSGGIVATATGSTAATNNFFARTSQTATAPAGAVGFNLRHKVTPASVGAGGTILYNDQPMLDMYNGIRNWVVGTGIPLVSCAGTGTGYRKPLKRSASLTLVEVA